MHTNSTYPAAGGVDPQEPDRHIAEMYRDVASGSIGYRHKP